MVFQYKLWDDFCEKLQKIDRISIPACEITEKTAEYIVLKHDVETDVPRALELAKIEHKYGHKGSYYVQAYLLRDRENIALLKQMQQMGHEISYHYDVLDSNKGDFENAIKEFESNRKLFEDNGFHLITVCQHGNPIVERSGYTSNRDFFRSREVQKLYPGIADIMVDYKTKYHTEYTYYSDAGRRFSTIYDPINNDVVDSEDKNIRHDDLSEVLNAIRKGGNAFISTHPHRWTKSAVEYTAKNLLFKFVKGTAKLLLYIPGMKRLMAKYFYLAKKI